MELKELLNNRSDKEQEELPRYVVRDAAFALRPQPPLEWVIERLISAGSVSMFYGEPGSKKTFSLLSLAVCVALGKPWLGLATSQRKVLIVDEESGERRFSLRLGASIRGELGDENTPIEFISLAGFKLDDIRDAAEILELLEEHQIGLLVIDAMADVMDGDENSKQETQPVFTALRRIAEKTNAAIIIIHHSNRAGGYRGSSAIKGALDLMVRMESEEGSQWIEFMSEKSRDIEAIQFTAVANWTEDQFYLLLAETEEKEKLLNKSQTYVIRYLTDHGPTPLPDIEGAADSCSPQAARQAVYALVHAGKVCRTNPGEKGRGVAAVYALAKEKGDVDAV